jgi:hypothetical protein
MSNTDTYHGDGLPPGPTNTLAEALGQLTKQFGAQAVQAQMDAANASNDMTKTEPPVAGLTATEVVPGSNTPKVASDGTGRWLSPGEAMAEAAGKQQQDELARVGYPLWQQTSAQKPS